MFNLTPITEVASGYDLFYREIQMRTKIKRHAKNLDGLFLDLPKSGRTWHRVMFGYYLSRLINANPKDCLNLSQMCLGNSLPMLKYSHNGSEWTADFQLQANTSHLLKNGQAKKLCLLSEN